MEIKTIGSCDIPFLSLLPIGIHPHLQWFSSRLSYVPKVPLWSQGIIFFFKRLPNSTCYYFAKDFCSYVHEAYWSLLVFLSLFLLWCYCQIFISRWYWSLEMSSEVFHPLIFRVCETLECFFLQNFLEFRSEAIWA